MYKIFINEKPYILTDKDVPDESFAQCKRYAHDPARTLEMIRECESMRGKGLVIICDDVEYAFHDFYTHFVAIEAAGGVVIKNQEEVLLIKRLGKWDLPKGKIDGDESNQDAALREVQEECGIRNLMIVRTLPSTYHTYKMHNHRFLKITYWFQMEASGDEKLIPQKEEHITEASWFAINKLDINSLDTYQSIRDLLKNSIF